MARSRYDALVFRGSPLSLSALAPGDLDVSPGIHAGRMSTGPAESLSVAMHASPTDAGAFLRTHLSRSTPPGRYEGTVTVDGVERDAVFEVEPETFLRLIPERLQLQAAPGEHVTRALTLLNLGNVAVEVRGAYAFGLFDVGGVDRAVSKTFGGEPAERGNIDRFIGMLADEHGGMVRVRVDEGEGTIEPGESRELSVTFALPSRMRPGHTYWGTWPLDYLRYYVRINVARGESHEESGR